MFHLQFKRRVLMVRFFVFLAAVKDLCLKAVRRAWNKLRNWPAHAVVVETAFAVSAWRLVFTWNHVGRVPKGQLCCANIFSTAFVGSCWFIRDGRFNGDHNVVGTFITISNIVGVVIVSIAWGCNIDGDIALIARGRSIFVADAPEVLFWVIRIEVPIKVFSLVISEFEHSAAGRLYSLHLRIWWSRICSAFSVTFVTRFDLLLSIFELHTILSCWLDQISASISDACIKVVWHTTTVKTRETICLLQHSSLTLVTKFAGRGSPLCRGQRGKGENDEDLLDWDHGW